MLLAALVLFLSNPKTIIFIIFVLVLFFGAKRIPELFKGVGQGVREFKDATRPEEQQNQNGYAQQNPNYAPQNPNYAPQNPQYQQPNPNYAPQNPNYQQPNQNGYAQQQPPYNPQAPTQMPPASYNPNDQPAR